MKEDEVFVRMEDNPGAVVNTDNAGLQAYKRRKNKDKEIDNMKKEISDIKTMLSMILEKVS